MARDTRFLEIKNLKMYYQVVGRGWVKAVDNVSLEQFKNENMGIVGESGCGKSSLALSILRVLPQNARIVDGEIIFDGTDLVKAEEKDIRKNFRWKRISMIFQGAMNALNPLLTVGDQIAEAILVHEDVTKEEAWKRAEELIRIVGIEPSRVRHYPFEFSGGMKQRAVIAMALALNPDLLIADEPTTALDVIVQAQVIDLIRSLQKEFGLSLLLISHDVSLVFSISDRVAVMYAGEIVECGPTSEIYHASMHPYTHFLMESVPDIRTRKRSLGFITGVPPNLLDPPPGCRFHLRCPYAFDECTTTKPAMRLVSSDHSVACYRADELEAKWYG